MNNNNPALSPSFDLGSLPAEPTVFEYDELWQHQLPMIDYIRREYGDLPLETLGGSFGSSVRNVQKKAYDEMEMRTLGQFLDAWEKGNVKLPYLRHISLNRSLPKLPQWLKLPEEFSPNWVDHPLLDRFSGPEIFFGQSGTSFGKLHQDHASVHVGFVQLAGEKEFAVLPPEASKDLPAIHGKYFPWQLRDSHIPFDAIDEVANSCGWQVQRVRMKAGQAMFLPADWWHTTWNHEDSISYSIRIINSTNILKTLQRHLEAPQRWLEWQQL